MTCNTAKLPLAVWCLSQCYWAAHSDITSQFVLYPSIFILDLSSCPYSSLFCELVCSQWPSFVCVVFSRAEHRTVCLSDLIARINLSSAAPSGNAAARPKLLISEPIPADMIPQGSNQQMILEETESSARKTTQPQQVLGISCYFEGLVHCIGHTCRLRK